jgi:alkylglycerol monooxygenase
VKLAWWLSIALGGLYFVTLPWQPYPGSAAVKGLSIATLAAIAWLSSERLISMALAASSVGDVLLDVGPQKLFVPGLLAFLTAHLLYTALFLQRKDRWRWWAVLPFVYAAVFAAWLAPDLGALHVPVFVYIAVIAAMVGSSFCLPATWMAPAGAFLFLVSDSVLAAGRFKAPVPLGGFLVWGTYYAAQLLIARGMLKRR